jgi:hypothetical protein
MTTCNSTDQKIRIYPFITVVQLLLFEYQYGHLIPYNQERKFKKLGNNFLFSGISRKNVKITIRILLN